MAWWRPLLLVTMGPNHHPYWQYNQPDTLTKATVATLTTESISYFQQWASIVRVCLGYSLIEYTTRALDLIREHWSWVWMFTPNYPGAVLSGRAESSHPHIRRPSVPDPNCNKGTLLLTFISLMTWLPNQSFPVISLTKHNLTLIISILCFTDCSLIRPGLSEHSQGPLKW